MIDRSYDDVEEHVTVFSAGPTERTVSEAQAEQRFRAIVEASPTPLLISRLDDGVILYANERLEALMEVDPGSLSGQKTPDFYADPADRPKVLEAVRQQGYVRDLELRIRSADDTVRWVSLSVQRLVFDGEPALATALLDITERKQTEAALRASEATYRGLFDNLAELVYIQDLDGRFLRVNEAVVRAYGYTRDELIGQTPAFLAAPGRVDVETTMTAFQRAVAGEPQRFEWWARRKDGSIFPKEVAIQRSNYFGRDVVIAVARDITERKRSEATLRFQTTLLEAQGEASIDGILVVGDDGTILSYNQRFVELWNLPSEVVTSRSDEAAVHAVLDQLQDPEAFLARIDHLYAHPKKRSRDTIDLRDGRVFDRYSAPVISNEGDYYGRIWFFRDVTAQKRYTQALEQARKEASSHVASLERDLEFGRKMQQGLLPATLPHLPNWEIAVRFRPAWQVAGDFYDAFELPTGRIGLIIADVSGKGVGAALFMALFQSLLRASADRASVVSTGPPPSDESILVEAVTATNRYITRVHKHVGMFASVFFAILDPDSGAMRYINAGHEPPVVVGAQGPRERLAPTGPALGLLADAGFEVRRIEVAPDELLLAFTDGVTEARNDGRDFFTEERLLSLLTPPAPTAARLLDRIEKAVYDFAGAAAPADDVTLLALRHRSAGEAAVGE